MSSKRGRAERVSRRAASMRDLSSAHVVAEPGHTNLPSAPLPKQVQQKNFGSLALSCSAVAHFRLPNVAHGSAEWSSERVTLTTPCGRGAAVFRAHRRGHVDASFSARLGHERARVRRRRRNDASIARRVIPNRRR